MSYPGIRYAVQAQNGTLFGIEMDEQGMLPKALEEACRKNNIKALFTSANVVNPTTGTMSYERRDALAVIARKYDLQVIEDDCWGIGPAVCPGFLSLCPERAWYISSFTKVVTSGLRFGWLVCPKARAREAQRVMRINSFGVSRAVVDIAFQLLISGDAIDVRRRVLDSVEKRVELTVNLLGKWNLKYRRDVPFVWLELPTGWRASSFVMACEREKIVVRGADEYALKGASVPDAVRISVNGNIPEESYTKALLKISELLSSPPMEAGELS